MTPDELRALADAATPGRWYTNGREVFSGGVPDAATCRVATVAIAPDARLICEAPSLARDHAALLDWAARAAVRIGRAHCECYDEPTLAPTDTPKDVECERCALLAEWAEMQERPS